MGHPHLCRSNKADLEQRGADGERGYGGGFGAEDAGAEGDVLPAMIGEYLHFFGSPSPFGADGQGCVLVSACVERGGEGVLPFSFGEQDFCWSGDELERGFEF